MLRDEKYVVRTVDFEAAAVDIDTPDDLARL